MWLPSAPGSTQKASLDQGPIRTRMSSATSAEQLGTVLKNVKNKTKEKAMTIIAGGVTSLIIVRMLAKVLSKAHVTGVISSVTEKLTVVTLLKHQKLSKRRCYTSERVQSLE